MCIIIYYSLHTLHHPQLQNDMKDVIARCKDSPSTVHIRKETSLASVSSRLVNLQTAGTNLISLGEGKKKGSVRGRKRKLIRSDSSGATEFSLKQTHSSLQSLYSKYKSALEGRRVSSGTTAPSHSPAKAEKTEEKREGETGAKREASPVVVLRRKERTAAHLKPGDIPIELKRKSWSFQRREGTQVKSRWEKRDTDRTSTVESSSATRQAVKSEKLNRQFSEETSFKRSYTLPGHFRGWKAPGLSVLEKAAAFSKVTEGTGLAAPYGLHSSSTTSSRTRRPSLDGRDLDTKKSESSLKAEKAPDLSARDNTVGRRSAGDNTVGKTPGVVQAAVVKTVISEQESVKRVSLIDIDTAKPQQPSDPDPLPALPLARVVSPSSDVLPSEQEAPPRVVTPDPPKQDAQPKSPAHTATPVTLATATTSSKSVATTAKKTRRSIQNLQIAGKVSHLKHVFNRQEEESLGETVGKSPSSTSPRAREIERRLSPDIVPKVSETAEMASEDAVCEAVAEDLLMADRPIPSPDITPKQTKEEAQQTEIQEEKATVKEEVAVKAEPLGQEVATVEEEEPKETMDSLPPPSPEPPQTHSPELVYPPPRPPSPIGYVLEESSDGESSYQSYDTEYSDEDEEEEEEEEEEEDEEEEEEEGVVGEVEDVDSGTISRRTLKTLQ